MQLGSAAGKGWRYTTDGGITWSHSTVATRIDPSQARKRVNATAQDKLLIVEGSGNLLVTTDCGVNYSYKSSQDIGISGVSCAVYKGSRIFLANAFSAVTSNDDGASWAAFSLPAGFAGQVSGFVADDTAYYLASSTGQLFMSTDGETWTQRILPAAFSPVYAVRLGSQILLGNSSACIVSNDGGVTWGQAQLTAQQNYSMQGPMYKVTTGGTSRLLGAGGVGGAISPVITSQALAAGVACVRAGQSAPAAIRTGTTPMIRVA